MDGVAATTLHGEDALVLLYCPLPLVAEHLLIGNPKKHDVGSTWASIEKYGYKDPGKWEPELNDGKGGPGEGNGRIKALLWGYNSRQPMPRGIRANADGVWHMPMLFGVDAISQAEALAYSFDHNNLTLAGGDFTSVDVSRLYDQDAYTTLLETLAVDDALPLTVDGDDLDLLLHLGDDPPLDLSDEDGEEPPEPNPNGKYPIAVALSWKDHQRWTALKAVLGLKRDQDAFLEAMDRLELML